MKRNRASRTLTLHIVSLALTACCASGVRAQDVRNLKPVGAPNPYTMGGPTEDAPLAVVAADLDGDGKLDVVTADVGTGLVSVRLGNGNGSLKAEAQYAVGAGPRALAVGDVNGDQIPDIVTANGSGNSVTVLLGHQDGNSMNPKGDGTFTLGGEYPVDTGPVAVAIEDMNEDGLPDLVTANTGSVDPVSGKLVHSSVSILPGHQDSGSMTTKPDGTFPTHVEFNTPPAPSSMAVADFDGDGHLDVITAQLGTTNPVANTFSFLKGDGAGALGPAASFAGSFLGPRSLQAADLNGDSKPDLIVVYPGARINAGDPQGVVGVIFGNGDGTFQAPSNYSMPEAPIAVVVVDFNGDNAKDILTANLGPRNASGVPITSNIGLLLNDGSGSFGQLQYFPLAAPPQSLAAADLDGDGFQDLAVGTAVQFLGPELPPKIHFTDPRVYVATNVADAAPIAVCHDVTVDTGSNDCSEPVTAAQVNNGSHDDDFGDSITLSLSPAGPYSVGDTAVTLTVTDNHGLSSTCNATVTVQDKTKPVVTLNGNANVTVECHSSFTDAGATATDNCSQNLTVTTVGTVDPNTPGTYQITYSATDDSMNTGQAIRTVVVKDTTPPVITLNGPDIDHVECHTSYTDPGATASDTCAGDLTSSIQTSGSVDVNTPGSYVLTYKVSDGPNTTTKKRTVVVQDTIAPVVTLNGAADVTIECGGTFTDPGASATDTCAGPQQVNVGGVLDTKATGDYTLTYFATDPSGNVGSATRTVHVRDTTAPVIGTVTLSKTVLSPANKRLIPIVVSYTPTDTCGGVTSWLTAVSSDPDSGTSGGDVPNDIQIVDEHHLSLRAEKVGGKTRTYTITVHCSDGTNESTKSVTVTVK